MGILEKRRFLKGVDRLKKTGTIRIAAFLIAELFLLCVDAAAAKYLIPGGCTVGIRADVQGLIVTGVEQGLPASRGGIKEGDVLLTVNGAPLRSAEELSAAAREGSVSLTFDRSGTVKQAELEPTASDGRRRLGVTVRDHVAGIGTVTYYDPEDRSFGALGHGITDSAGRELVPITGGIIVESSVSDVVKGRSGSAGQLTGSFRTDHIEGTLESNTEYGVFGAMEAPEGMPIAVAERGEIKPGPAEICANVEGTQIRSYSAEILKVYGADRPDGRDLLLRVTDPELLRQTGGIVQGMSGSPILQDGKLVGAVTHVLVNTPDTGYGISMETMLKAAERTRTLCA